MSVGHFRRRPFRFVTAETLDRANVTLATIGNLRENGDGRMTRVDDVRAVGVINAADGPRIYVEVSVSILEEEPE